MKKQFIVILILIFSSLCQSSAYGCHIPDKGREMSMTDFHMHMLSQKLSDRLKEYTGQAIIYGKPIMEENADMIISKIDSAGIKKALVLSGAYFWGMDPNIFCTTPFADPSKEYEEVKAENDWTAEQAAKYPNRLIPLFSLNPLKDYAISEMDRCFDVLKMPGMKVHFTNSGVNLRNKEHLDKLEKVFAHAEAKRIPILIHFMNYLVDGFGPQDARIFIDEILTRHPRLKICIAHLGGPGGYDDNAGNIFDTFIEAFKKNRMLDKKNVYFDISSVVLDKPLDYMDVTTKKQLRRISMQIKQWGLEQILFGSDFFMSEPKSYLNLLKKKLPLKKKDFNKLVYKDPACFLNQ